VKKITLINELIEIGLDQRQAQVYLACLTIGGGTVHDIALASKMERTACYYYVKQLVTLRLLHKGAQRKSVFYPADPNQLKVMVEKKSAALDSLLPSVTDLFSQMPNRSRVIHFEGETGLAELYNVMETLMADMPSTERVYAFSRLFEAMDVMPDFLTGFFDRRAAMAAPSMTILPVSERPSATRQKRLSDNVVATRYAAKIAFKRYLPDRFMPSGMSTVMIARDHVATADFKSLFGTLTVSSSLADTWRGFHQYIWSTLKDN
jgi:predicted transcriptional regulator